MKLIMVGSGLPLRREGWDQRILSYLEGSPLELLDVLLHRGQEIVNVKAKTGFSDCVR